MDIGGVRVTPLHAHAERRVPSEASSLRMKGQEVRVIPLRTHTYRRGLLTRMQMGRVSSEGCPHTYETEGVEKR